MWYLAIGILIFLATIVLGKKIIPKGKESKQSAKLIKSLLDQDVSPHSLKTHAFLNKNISLICLEEDGKIYGTAFKNQQAPSLPHVEGCLCKYIEMNFRISEVFNDSKKTKTQKYKTDLGDLDFYSYKYYKYLLIANLVEDLQKKEEYKQLGNNLDVNTEIKTKIYQHLNS